MLLLRRDETVRSLKQRICQRLGLPDDVWGVTSTSAPSSPAAAPTSPAVVVSGHVGAPVDSNGKSTPEKAVVCSLATSLTHTARMHTQ